MSEHEAIQALDRARVVLLQADGALDHPALDAIEAVYPQVDRLLEALKHIANYPNGTGLRAPAVVARAALLPQIKLASRTREAKA